MSPVAPHGSRGAGGVGVSDEDEGAQRISLLGRPDPYWRWLVYALGTLPPPARRGDERDLEILTKEGAPPAVVRVRAIDIDGRVRWLYRGPMHVDSAVWGSNVESLRIVFAAALRDCALWSHIVRMIDDDLAEVIVICGCP